MTDPAEDIAQLAGTARVLHRVLAEVDAGRIEAADWQRGYLRGVVDTLRQCVSIRSHRDVSENETPDERFPR